MPKLSYVQEVAALEETVAAVRARADILPALALTVADELAGFGETLLTLGRWSRRLGRSSRALGQRRPKIGETLRSFGETPGPLGDVPDEPCAPGRLTAALTGSGREPRRSREKT
jgi:hypothetical protein